MTPKEEKPAKPKLVLPPSVQDIRALATWSFVKRGDSGNPCLEQISVVPAYPLKKMRLDALRKAATLYNTVARVHMYGRLKKADWYEKYVSGQLPDLFTQIYHDIMEANGGVPEMGAVQADIEKRIEEKRAAVPGDNEPRTKDREKKTNESKE